MKNVVTYTPPKMRPLPGTITDVAIREATLPVKIEAARRAIAECEDLPELLRYRDQAEGLAAAVRIMKHVAPEMVRSANEMVADAWRKGGELLAQYSNLQPSRKSIDPVSPRTKVARTAGLKPREVQHMTRIAAAPKAHVYRAVSESRNIERVASQLPAVNISRSYDRNADALNRIMYGDGGRTSSQGLSRAMSGVKSVPLDAFKQLQPDERKVVKTKITEIVELLDEMDRLCK